MIGQTHMLMEREPVQSDERTFTLNDVKMETPVGNALDSHKMFDRLLNVEVSSYRNNGKNLPRKAIEYVSTTKSLGFDAHGTNGFLYTLSKAYANHHSLTLKPCDLMYVISNGLAIHIKKNSDKLKEYFSDQVERYKIVVRRDGFVKGSLNNDWFGVFDEFASSVEKTVLDTELISLMKREFASTTSKSMAARNISIMNAMQPYCSYELQTMCGIPQITLRGSQEEWDHVRKFANYLRKYDLDWWIDELDKVLVQFVAVTGDIQDDEIDLEFWNNMVKKEGGSGGPYYSGWISSFFPYMEGGSGAYRQNDFELHFTSSSIPSGISSVDVLWKYLGTDIPMKVHTGMMCCTVNKKGSLRPKMLFCVEDCGPQPPVVTNVNGYAVGDKDVDGFVITNEAVLTSQQGRYCNPAAIHYYAKYNRIEGITVNCDLCKTKNISVSVSHGENYDLCMKCVDRVTTFTKLNTPPPSRYGFGYNYGY